MPKKIRPSNLADGTEMDLPNAATIKAESISLEAKTEPMMTMSIVGAESRMTIEDKEKLDKYDALEKTVLELNKKNEELEATLADCLEKKNADATDAKELEDLKKKLSEAEKKITALEKDNKTLKEEIDSYLMKISELTFESAKLASQLSKYKNAKPNQMPMQQHQPSYGKPYIVNNGYESW